MTKVLALLKKAWAWFTVLVTTRLWTLVFPAVALLVVLLATFSLWAFIAFALWVITIIYNTDEE